MKLNDLRQSARVSFYFTRAAAQNFSTVYMQFLHPWEKRKEKASREVSFFGETNKQQK